MKMEFSPLKVSQIHVCVPTHTHTLKHTQIYIYVCVCGIGATAVLYTSFVGFFACFRKKIEEWCYNTFIQ